MAEGAIGKDDVIKDDLTKGLESVADSLSNVNIEAASLLKTLKGIGADVTAAKSTGDLAKATNQLTTQEKELIKLQNQLSTALAKSDKEYVDYKKGIDAVNKATKDKSALDGKQAKDVTLLNSSIKQLKEALKQNQAAYESLTTAEKRNSEAGLNLKKIVDEQKASLNSLKPVAENTEKGVIGLGGAFDTLAPGISNGIKQMYGFIKAGLAFIATPIGLIIAGIAAAFGALVAYFKSSEEGQNRLNKIMAIGSAVFEQFMNIVEDVGEAIFNAFSNPKQAILDFVNLVKTNITNRVIGLIELFPQLGKAIQLTFSGKFKEAATIATNAVAKVAIGIDNVVGKTQNAIAEINKLVEVGINFGTKIAAIQAKIDKEERNLTVNRAKTALEVSKLREEAALAEGGIRRAALLEAISLEQELSDQELAQATRVKNLAALKVKANGDDKDALAELATAQAGLYTAQATAFDNTLKFQKQIAALNQQEFNDEKAREDEEVKRRDQAIKNRILANKQLVEKEFLAANKLLDDKINLIKQEVIQGIKTREQGDKEILALQKSTTDEYIQNQIDRAEKLLKVEGLTSEEILAIDKELAKLRLELTDAFYKQIEDKDAKNLAKLQNNIAIIQGIYENFAGAVSSIFSIGSDQRLKNLDNESKEVEKHLQKQLELAGDNEQQKERLQKKADARQEDIEHRRIEQLRKNAKVEKVLAVFSAGLAATQAAITAFATVKPTYPAGLAASIAAAIYGAAQVAAIIAKPLPQFFTGVDSAPGGLARVGEEGPELMREPGGHLKMSPVDSIIDVKKGTKIWNRKDTLRMLALSGLNSYNTLGSKEDARLSDRVVDKLEQMNSNLVANRNSGSDYYLNGLIAYEVRKKDDNFREHVRAITQGSWIK